MSAKKGILISNLGSPDEPTTESVRKYLDQFLMDPYVIDLPYLLRALLIKGIVLRTRPAKSAAAYATIWTEKGSPLVVYTKELTEKLQKILGDQYSVKFAMRYGNPSFEGVFQEFEAEGIREVDLLPLYPQWALASNASTLAHIDDLKYRPRVKRILKSFYDNKDFIDLFAARFQQVLSKIENLSSLKTCYVFSYHGLPERHIHKAVQKTDKQNHCSSEKCVMSAECCRAPTASPYCYRSHCQRTTDAHIKKLDLKEEESFICFQSRLGPDKWLQPPTDDLLKKLPSLGFERCILFSSAFTADCLETLEELAERGMEDFKHAGGKDFHLVPSLNAEDDWAQALSRWVKDDSLFTTDYVY